MDALRSQQRTIFLFFLLKECLGFGSDADFALSMLLTRSSANDAHAQVYIFERSEHVERSQTARILTNFLFFLLKGRQVDETVLLFWTLAASLPGPATLCNVLSRATHSESQLFTAGEFSVPY